MYKKRILVVDDEPDFLAIIKLRLEAHNYDVITTLRGKEALDIIKENKPDAVLLDIVMPELDGLSVLRKIREEDKDLPVFIVTAHSDVERFKSAKELGASGYIIKESDLNKEVENITNALNLIEKHSGAE